MRRYYVYVIELRKREGAAHVEKRGPRSFLPDVYVGSSALRPEARFQKHKHPEDRGNKFHTASKHVVRRGFRLRPDLYQGLNPYGSRAEAKQAEQMLRRNLERKGYKVYGSCSPRVQGCWL